MGYALRRTSARVVLVLVVSGLLFTVYRAVRPFRHPTVGSLGPGRPLVIYATAWDLAVGALAVVAALAVAAFLWRGRATSR
jgi:hypothetical protein